MDYKDMPLDRFVNLARESSDELGAHDNTLWNHQSGNNWTMDDPETALFLASARSITLELIRRIYALVAEHTPANDPAARIAELEGMVGLAIIHIDGKAQSFSERIPEAVLQRLRGAVPDAVEKYDTWLIRHMQNLARDDSPGD